MFTAFQACHRRFFIFFRHAPFENKYIIGYLIPIVYNTLYLIILVPFLYGLVTPTHVYGVSGLPQAFFCCFLDMPFWKRCVLVNILCFYLFWKTSNRRGTQSWAKKWPNFVLSSDLDPIGEQNDVQYLSIYCQYWSIYGTAYGTYYCCCCCWLFVLSLRAKNDRCSQNIWSRVR